MERMNLFQDNNKPQIIFYFAECMEFPDYGEYKEFPTLAQAISLFEKCPGTLLNAVKCVGFILHDDSIYDDVKQPLMTSKHVLKDDINYISHYANTTLVQEAIKEAECYLRSKENSKPKVTTGMFDNCDPLPAEMRKNFKFTDEEIRYLSGVGEMFKNDKSVNFEIMEGPMPPAPIQDENRFICFRVEGKEYSLRIVSKEEMQRVKEEVNKNSKYTYDWFKEESGDHNWVLYNTDMYEISNCGGDRYLHYIELSGLLPMVPINATSCHHMFYNCCNMEELDLKHFNTENILTMEGMFFKCSKISKLDLRLFNTAKVTNMLDMFAKCYNLEELDLSSFSTVNVIYMINMFKDCESLKTLNLSSFSTENVKSLHGVFSNCYSLKELNLSNFSTGRVTDMGYLFAGCESLKALDLSNLNTENVTDMHYMFAGCYSLKELNISSFNTGNVTDMSYMFYDCSEFMSLDLSNFNTEKVTSMYCLFKDCESLKTLNLSSFNTENVTDMHSMFKGCTFLEQLDLSSFDTGNVANMSGMFKSCRYLKHLNLSSFNTENVVDMSDMFWECDSLEQLDLSSFCTINVEFMNNMFRVCSRLKYLDLSSFDTANVKYKSDVFKGCNALTTVRVGNHFSLDLERRLKKNIEGIKIIQCASLKRVKPRSFPKDYNIN